MLSHEVVRYVLEKLQVFEVGTYANFVKFAPTRVLWISNGTLTRASTKNKIFTHDALSFQNPQNALVQILHTYLRRLSLR